MIRTNKISRRISNAIRNGIIFGCVVALMLAVAPNFAQDYSQLGDSDPAPATAQSGQAGDAGQSGEITPESLRNMLREALVEDPGGSPDDSSGTVAGGDQGPSYDQSLINDWQRTNTELLGRKLARLVRKLPDFPGDTRVALSKATSPRVGMSGLDVFLIIFLTAVVGLLAERFTTRKLLDRLHQYIETRSSSSYRKYKFIILRVIIQLVGVGVMAVVTYVGIIYFRNENPFFELLFMETIAALVMLRLWRVLVRNIFSPGRPALRPIPLDNRASMQTYYWALAFFVVIEFGGAVFAYMTRAGMSDALLGGLLVPYTLSLNLIVLSQVWLLRHRITAMFIVNGETENHSVARDFFASAWPYLFTLWLLLLWTLWLYKAFLGNWEDANYVSISWWITLAFFIADRIFYGLVKNVINIEWLHSPTFEKRSNRFIQITLNGFRVFMVAVAIYMISMAWGLNTDSLMQSSYANRMLAHCINMLVIATITYVIWEFFNALIERQLPEETDGLASLEGEGGGAGATRAETLLPLMRTVLTVVLFTFVLLSVLNSLGIAITPLLAGAGVVGIAIGFGAQKLVQDVLSGIFFLIDDAFRKSEYIEIEELRGTVEKISLRSMQLRHHLGAVQTIPYGEIKTVKNLSRDWITMKLELRLAYDTDIEKVRKIIKKVGLSMLEDPELGPSFILPLKSQGVLRVEESALIFRMKFTTKPGEQWVIRREAYRQVRDALAEAGIFFAHREVRVRLPDDQLHANGPENREAMDQALEKAGAAAATATVEAEEASKRNKIDYDNEM